MEWSEGDPFDFENAIKTMIFGQKRTSKNKQFVAIGDDYVWKGPYSREKTIELIARYNILYQWNLPLVLLPAKEVHPSENGYFFRFVNLAKDYPMEFEEHQESFSSYRYKILKRNGLLKISDLLKVKGNEWIYNFIPQITISLSCFSLLNIGDLHTCNILADIHKKTVWIIDFDQNRGNDVSGDFFFLSKPPAKAIAEKWREIIIEKKDEIIREIEKINTKTTKVVDMIKKIGSEQKKEQVRKEPSLGKMSYGGPFRSVTYSGITVDVAKSGLQKHIRRGEVDDALKFAYELYRFNELGAKAIVTNLYNRLAIIAVEDIGPANVPLVLKVLEMKEPLYDLVVEMCNSAKTRILSHLARAYSIHMRKTSKKHGLTVDKQSRDGDDTDSMEFWFPDECEDEMRYIANVFLERLKQKDRNAYTWAQYFCENYEKILIKPRNRRRKAAVVLWRMMEKHLPNDKIVEKLFAELERYYFTLSENNPFLRMAIFLILHDDRPGAEHFIPGKYTGYKPEITEEELLHGEYELVVKDYVLDKHTAQGRRGGADREKFVTEGALVHNEDPRFDEPVLKKIYSL